jgi:hypothetical protein
LQTVTKHTPTFQEAFTCFTEVFGGGNAGARALADRSKG